MQVPHLLPSDINAEELLNYYPEGLLKVALRGLHKRNTYHDIVEVEEMVDHKSLKITLGRMSLYNVLPEYMFHPNDRFDNLPQNDEKEAFRIQVDEQEQEMSDAYRFFSPIDVLLFRLRAQVRRKLGKYTQQNYVMQRIIGDRLTKQQLNNRFISQIIPFLPQSKHIRGNLTLLTLILRKVFMNEELKIDVTCRKSSYRDESPRYGCEVGMILGDEYIDNTYEEDVTVYDIHYWSDDECDEHFMKFTEEVEELRQFLQDFFFSVETELYFNITQDYPPLRLDDNLVCNYLNYNTNI